MKAEEIYEAAAKAAGAAGVHPERRSAVAEAVVGAIADHVPQVPGPADLRRERARRARDGRIRALAATGLRTAVIAERVGISSRQVRRVLAARTQG